MNIADNKKLVEAYFDAINNSNEQGILEKLTDDFKFECMAVIPKRFHFVWDKAAFAAAPRLMSRAMVKPIQIWIISMTGEEERMSVEAQSHGELQNGKIYENAYNFLFRFRDGKICSVREYSCSHLAQECFGEFEQTFD